MFIKEAANKKMDNMPARESFRMCITPSVFSERVRPGEGLKTFLEQEGLVAVVSPRDILKLYRENPDDRRTLAMNLMPNAELINLFRGVRDGNGRRVYKDAEIVTGTRASPRRAMNIQTFVQVDKLVGFNGLVELLDHFDNPGLSKMPAFILTIMNKRERYMAIYAPAIIETIPTERFNVPLTLLRERARNEKTMVLPTFNKDPTVIELETIIKRVEKILDGAGDVIQVIKDGAHRAYLTHLAGTTLPGVEIRKSDALPTGVPVHVSDMLVTRSKPEKLEDRYPGYVECSWLDIKDRGIDG